jgi:hypothetical protein
MRLRYSALLGALTLVLCNMSTAEAQPAGFNYDEAKVPQFTLPDPLVLSNGKKVADAENWIKQRRPEILKLFETEMYGRSPGRPVGMTFAVTSVDRQALGGRAIRKVVSINFTGKPDGPAMDLLIYLPKDAGGPVPTFVGLNFGGNHTVQPDPGIAVTTQWVRNDKEKGITDNRANEQSRGSAASRWPVEQILARGYGVATAYYGDIDPDFDDGFQNGVQPLFYQDGQMRNGARSAPGRGA